MHFNPKIEVFLTPNANCDLCCHRHFNVVAFETVIYVIYYNYTTFYFYFVERRKYMLLKDI